MRVTNHSHSNGWSPSGCSSSLSLLVHRDSKKSWSTLSAFHLQSKPSTNHLFIVTIMKLNQALALFGVLAAGVEAHELVGSPVVNSMYR